METKKIRNGGFTLLETLLTVAILIILLGVSAVGVVYYRDYLKITELDNAARDIYMAAENRAVLMQNSGAAATRLKNTADGGELEITKDDGTKQTVSLVVLSNATETETLNDLLPVGVIDPTLRAGHFYILYDKSTRHVFEVFYAKKSFSLPLLSELPEDKKDMKTLRGSRSGRVSYYRENTANRCLVGHYGKDTAGNIGTKPLPTPGVEIIIENGEELTLKVTYTLPEGVTAGPGGTGVPVTPTPSIKLYYPTGSTTPIKSLEPVLTFSGNTATYEMVLDSLSGKQFKELVSSDLGKDFTVTAGLKLSAVADGYIDSAYYATGTDNSLFAKETGDGPIAYIANLRHLQNLCANFSEVGDGITEAKQTADIECEEYKNNQGTVLDDAYKFTPITNENLSDYNGQSKHIRNLSTKTVAAAGLFGTVSTNLTVQNTRVCWTRPEALVKDDAIVCAVSGTNAGGLIGAVTGGTVKIENSFAATTVRGTAAGGLVGSKTGSGTLTIKNSYADCYLSGQNAAGGLVGQSSAAPTLTNSYAAGFIVDSGTTTAGLVNGSVDTATNCYSVVRVIQKDTDGKETLEEPATPMYTDWDKDSGSAFYLSSPADVTENQFGDAFEYTNEDNSPETHVYNLRHKLDGTVETLTPPYPFPGLKDLPHYGDWAKQDSIPAGLVYYEKYKETKDGIESITYGVWGVHEDGTPFQTLKETPPVRDGYALIFEGAAPGNYTIKYGNEGSIQTWPLEGSPISVDVGGKTYALLPLPDDIVTGKLSEDRPEAPEGATAKFYQKLTCGTGANMRTYWFNPHFAKTVEVTEPVNLNLPVTSISVRTPRHFYDLSNFQSNYVNGKTYSFQQELDLDYGSYEGYPDIFAPKGGELPFKQLPIGQGPRTDVSFRGTYDGGCHKIKNVFFISTENKYCHLGLFGWVNKSNGISLKNIVYELDPNRVETVTYHGDAQSFGTLVGTLQQGTMTNCAVYGVNMRITGHELPCGGLVGSNSGLKSTITGCSAELVSLTVENSWPGGLVGSSGGTVENSYAVGKIVVTGAGASGLVNESFDGTITNCYAAVSLTATDERRGLSNTSSNVENSGFLVGTFKYRGEEYTVDNTYAGPDEQRITPAKLAETVTLAEADKTVKNFPDSYPTPPGDYSGDYAGNFPYLTGVKDAANQAVHYGLWPVAATEAPPVGLAYYEQYDNTNNSHGLEGVYGDVEFKTLKNESAPLDGYALVVLEEGYDPSAPIIYTVTYGGKSWTWQRNNAKWDNPQSADVQEPFTVTQDGKEYQVFPLPAEVITGALANAASFYQELKVERGGVAASQTFYFNPHFAKTVHSAQPEADPKTEADRVSVRTPRHLYDLSVYSDTYAPKGLYYGQEFDLNYQTYSWDYDMKPTWNDKDSVYQQDPIGTNADHSFTGTYDGGTHKIENIVYDDNKADHYFGLFGYAGGTLTKINYLTGGRNVVAAGTGNVHVGTLAGHAATMTDCTATVSGPLDFSGNGAGIYGGGLAGRIEQATGCTVTVTGDLTVRGTGEVIEDNDDKNGTSTYAGGLAGYLGPDAGNVPDTGITFTGCKATVEGAVTVTGTGVTNASGGGGDTFGGGLAGRVTDNKVVVSDCHAKIGTLSVSGPGAYTYGGGLTGYAGTITDCTATITGDSLTVTGTGDAANAYGGGLTGGTGGSSTTIIWDESGQPKRDENGNIMYVANWVTKCSVDAEKAALTVTGEGTRITKKHNPEEDPPEERDPNDKHPIEGNEVYGGGLVGRTYGKVSGCKAEVNSLEVTGCGVFAYGGGLVGYADTMDTCTEVSISKVTVTGEGSQTNAYGGGLAGQPHWGVTNCAIENSGLEVIVTGTGQDVYGGGLVARTFGTVQDSSAEIGALTVTGKKGEGEYKRYVSGSGLTNTAAWVAKCDAIVRTAITVTGTSDNTNAYIYGAGLVGQPSQEVSTSTALVKALDVEGHGRTTMAGGLVADTAMPLTSCAAGVGTLEVTGTGYETYGGGLAGRASYVKTEDDKPLYGVERCEAGTDSLKVTGSEETDTYTYVGGLVGSSVKGSVNLSYAVGRISKNSTGVTYVGGLVGYSEGAITNSYAAVDVPLIKDTNCGGLVGQILKVTQKKDDAGNVVKDENGNDVYVYELNPGGIDNSYWLKGTFRYRGEYYTMTGSGLTDSGDSITPDALKENINTLWISICKPVDDLPASGDGYESWMEDYVGKKFPYPGNTQNKAWAGVHYGLWPIPVGTGPVGEIDQEAEKPNGLGIKDDNVYYWWDEAIGLGDGMPVFKVKDGKIVCVGWMKNCIYNEGTLDSWTLTTDPKDFDVNAAKMASYAALPDAALPEPAALPAEPEPKPKDESDPIP